MKETKKMKIPGFVNRFIDKNGKIYDQNNNLLFSEYSSHLPELLLSSFVGQIDCEILVNDLEENISIKNVSYKITEKELQIIKESTDSFKFHGIEFKRIPDYSMYYISQNGIIFSKFYMKFLSRSLNHNNYLVVSITNNKGKRKTVKVHRMVYKTWKIDIPDGITVNHINFDHFDNFYHNLEPLTSRDNILDAVYKGKHSSSIWKKEEIEIICKSLEDNKSSKEINKIFPDKSRKQIISIINLILHRNAWSDISSKYSISNFDFISHYRNGVSKLNDNNVRLIKEMISKGISNRVITEYLNSIGININERSISEIKRGRTWKHIQ